MSYSYTDITYHGPLNYFRLKQIDVDGRFEYSRTVYVNGDNNSAAIKMITNTFTGEVRLPGIPPSDLQHNYVKAYNSSGQQVACHITGRNSIAIDAKAPPGIYFLRIKDQTFKLFKQ